MRVENLCARARFDIGMKFQEVQLFNRFTNTVRHYAHLALNNSTTKHARSRATLAGVYTTAHHALMVSGVAALTTLAVLFFRPDLAHQLRAFTPFDRPSPVHPQVIEVGSRATPMDMPSSRFNATTAAVADKKAESASTGLERDFSPAKLAGTERQQRWVTNWLSKRYRVANDATDMLVSAAYVTAHETKIDPLLILAVVAIESGFNPFAESAVGAQGLMQVMAKIHHEKFQTLGGVKAALNPVANIRVGSLILKDYVTRGGSVEAGLKMYVGAAAFENDAGYGSKVLAEYRRLKEVANGKSVPLVFPQQIVVARTQPKTVDVPVESHKVDSVIEEKPMSPEAANVPERGERIAAAM